MLIFNDLLKSIIVIACIFFGQQVCVGQQPERNSTQTEAFPSKQFIDSVIYGVGAGTLVGIAAISNFKKDIGANADPQNIARGASWGLYGGILLGLYLSFSKDESFQSPADDAYSDISGSFILRQLGSVNFVPFEGKNGSFTFEINVARF